MLYLFSTVSIVPQLAKLNGRTALPIQKSGNLQPLTYFTPLLNRHYVTPTLKANLMEIANEFKKETQQLHLTYLDANFPFIDGFPLIPHLIPN